MTKAADASEALAGRAQTTIEVILCACVVLSPWFFGSTTAAGELGLVVGLSAAFSVFVYWCLGGRLPVWKAGRIGLVAVAAMTGLALAAASHLVPWPDALVRWVAPGLKDWSATLTRSPEIDAMVSASPASGWFFGRGWGLHPSGSFDFFIRLALLSGLFVVVGSLDRPRRVLHRASVVAVLLGAAISLFGIAQHFGSHDGRMYWTYEIVGGLGFVPFVNRNHYPFYLNLLMGLSIGLLWSRLETMGRHWFRMILDDALACWLIVAVVFMAASLIVCVSRGGVISGLSAVALVGFLRLRKANLARAVSLSIAIAVPVVLVLTWVGFSIYESRLNMLGDADRYTQDGRWHLWQSAVRSVPEFPWFGSGGETYRYWETIQRTDDPSWRSARFQSLRADNEYLDVLNEYGLVGLACLLIFVGALLWQTLRAARHSALAAGAAIGLTAVALHSFVDFGLRVPATAVLATSIAA